MSMEMESGKGRIWVIDVARFYAMALVFYGHFIERFMVLPVFFPGDFYGMKLPSVEGYIKGLVNTVFWIPLAVPG